MDESRKINDVRKKSHGFGILEGKPDHTNINRKVRETKIKTI